MKLLLNFLSTYVGLGWVPWELWCVESLSLLCCFVFETLRTLSCVPVEGKKCVLFMYFVALLDRLWNDTICFYHGLEICQKLITFYVFWWFFCGRLFTERLWNNNICFDRGLEHEQWKKRYRMLSKTPFQNVNRSHSMGNKTQKFHRTLFLNIFRPMSSAFVSRGLSSVSPLSFFTGWSYHCVEEGESDTTCEFTNSPLLKLLNKYKTGNHREFLTGCTFGIR